MGHLNTRCCIILRTHHKGTIMLTTTHAGHVRNTREFSFQALLHGLPHFRTQQQVGPTPCASSLNPTPQKQKGSGFTLILWVVGWFRSSAPGLDRPACEVAESCTRGGSQRPCGALIKEGRGGFEDSRESWAVFGAPAPPFWNSNRYNPTKHAACKPGFGLGSARVVSSCLVRPRRDGGKQSRHGLRHL